MVLTTSDFQAQQSSYLERETQNRMSGARVLRERMIFAFQKEFVLAAASRDGATMDFEAAKVSMEAATLHLFPPVTEINASEYFNRAG